MAKIVLKQVKLVGIWQPNTMVDIRFLSSPIGSSPLLVSSTGQWVNYPANTSFQLPGVGNLWQYWNNHFLTMCSRPLDIDPTQINAHEVISGGFGDAHVKYDIIPS